MSLHMPVLDSSLQSTTFPCGLPPPPIIIYTTSVVGKVNQGCIFQILHQPFSFFKALRSDQITLLLPSSHVITESEGLIHPLALLK